jgi:hypothetical protein
MNKFLLIIVLSSLFSSCYKNPIIEDRTYYLHFRCTKRLDTLINVEGKVLSKSTCIDGVIDTIEISRDEFKKVKKTY